MTLSHGELLAMLAAADYLHVEPLLQLCSARLSRLLLNRTPDEVAKFVKEAEEKGEATTEAGCSLGGVTSDFTAAEKEQLLDSLLWTSSLCGDPAHMVAEPPDMIKEMKERRRDYLRARQAM